MRAATTADMRDSLRRHLLATILAIVMLVGGVGGWAVSTEFSGAVIASGTFVVNSSVKKVQHLTGGVVGELFVRDGDKVRAGDILVRLDETIARANFAVVAKSLDENVARQARLMAERDSLESIAFPGELLKRRDDPDVARTLDSEQRLFELRHSARSGQKSQLRERIAQSREEIQGHSSQIAAKDQQIGFISQELVGVRELWQKNLIPIQRVMALEREKSRLDGDRGQLVAAMAQVKGRISETELQIIQVEQELRSEVAKELRETQAKISELTERKVAADDQLKRIDIRSPQSGTVHQLSVYTVGGVIGPGEQIMLVVPTGDELIVEAKISPQDVDQVRVGHSVVLRLVAFNQHTTPELTGQVGRISADLTSDQRTGVTFYTVRIIVPPSEIARLGGLSLIPGMPVEAFIQTAPRTVLSYLTKPLSDQVTRAFREK